MAQPPDPVRVLLEVIEDIIGPDTDVARYLAKAVRSEDPLDLMLAQAAFEELDAAYRADIAAAVRARVRQLLAA
ncbi:MAG: hypothetical protein HYR63_17875 [Proteobacteria bacterium]|nr:hypothetical protein [Pseudomonadota bacterium]MBI3496176.1 hypothetical protein [Pseudomonadota bacterium]